MTFAKPSDDIAEMISFKNHSPILITSFEKANMIGKVFNNSLQGKSGSKYSQV